jgi:uncharacterized protein (DUF305 family)
MTRRISFVLASCFVIVSGAAGLIAMEPNLQDPEPRARPDLVRGPYSKADVEFMQGMIPHHAQAVVMGRMARTHGAREDVRILCERIIVAQGDEITYMRNWLRDRGQVVPPAGATHHTHTMNGTTHEMLMPGMLTPEEMAVLDKARGPEWDRLFLAGMIKHHEGALTMVDGLFETYGALQDDDMFKFASDIYADQTTEIDFMQKMLDEMPSRK